MFRERVLHVVSFLAVAAAVIVGMPGTVHAQPSNYTDWTGANGNWTDSTWDADNPNVTSGEQVWSTQGQITVNTPDANCSNMWLGESGPNYVYNPNNSSPWFGTSAGTASLVVASGGVLNVSGNLKIGYAGQGYGSPPVLIGAVGCGTLQAGGAIATADGTQFEVGVWGGTGTMTQTGGTVSQAGNAGGQIYIGAYATGTYNMSGGLIVNAPYIAVGYGGASYWCAVNAAKVGIPAFGTMNQTGGTIQMNTTNPGNDYVIVADGYDNGSTGVYNISGNAALSTPVLILGAIEGGGGSFVTGGANDTPVYPNGTFNQTGGNVTVTGQMVVGMDRSIFNASANGAKGTGAYNFYGGTLTDGGNGASLTVRFDAPATGTFQGYGTVNFSGTLTNNGRVIADGGVLDMSSFSAVANTVTNVAANGSTTNGWFAKNGGELILPPVPVTGNGTYTWGGDISLVHSVQLAFHGVVSSGNFSVNLFDTANAQAPSTAGLGPVTGLWDIIPPPAASYSNFDAAFRYDDALAGVNEPFSRLYEYSGGQWRYVPDTLDAPDHLLSAVGLSGSGYFAVATGPATAAWAVNGSGTWSNQVCWSGSNVAGINPQDAAVFGAVLTSGTATVALDGSRGLSSLGFSTTGANSYVIAGTNTLTLSNTGLAAATISDSGGNHTIAVPITLGNNLNVTAAAGSTLTVSGAIGELNPGTTLSLSGGGTLVISGSTTYSGATTVNSSTLQIGGSGISGGQYNGDALISRSITMSNNATVAFNPTGQLSYGGTVGGSGQFVKAGSGLLTLNAANAYSGSTTISGGTLSLGGANVGYNLPPTTALSIAASGAARHGREQPDGGQPERLGRGRCHKPVHRVSRADVDGGDVRRLDELCREHHRPQCVRAFPAAAN